MKALESAGSQRDSLPNIAIAVIDPGEWSATRKRTSGKLDGLVSGSRPMSGKRIGTATWT